MTRAVEVGDTPEPEANIPGEVARRDGAGLRGWPAGLVAGVVGLGLAHALAAVLTPGRSPVVAVAERVIALTPGPVAEAAIQALGTADKPFVVGVVTLVTLGLFAAAGYAGRGRGLLAPVLFALVAAAGVLATLLRSDRDASWVREVAPVALGLFGAVAAWGALRGSATAPGALTRRAFVTRAGLFAVAASAAAVTADLTTRGKAQALAARDALRLPRATAPEPPAGSSLPGLPAWRSDTATFYRIDTALVPPTVDPATWRLRIHGMVEREIELTFEQLVARPADEAWATLSCVSNPVGGDLVGNAWWTGVRVADLLAEAGVRPGADAILQTSHDSWTCGTPLQAVTDDRNALLAYAMNGEALPIEHGFPVRMVVPGLYGFVSATKWLVDIEVTRFDTFTAYWTQRGWAAQAPARLTSRIDKPSEGARVTAGPLDVGGVAWHPHTGIAAVEVSLDGRAWQKASLGTVPNVDTWVQWHTHLDVGAGPHTLRVRATSRDGEVQTSIVRDVVPDGATGLHSVTFSA